MEVKVTRIYTGPDNESHFADMEIPSDETETITYGSDNDKIITEQSEPIKVKSIIFREVTGHYERDLHPAPRRQFVITLKGELEIETGDGTRRRFGPGDILLAEDTKGRGHISRSIGNQPRKMVFITLD